MLVEPAGMKSGMKYVIIGYYTGKLKDKVKL